MAGATARQLLLIRIKTEERPNGSGSATNRNETLGSRLNRQEAGIHKASGPIELVN